LATDYNSIKTKIVKRLVETPFRHPYQFRIEVKGYPQDDFDLLIKEISYGPDEIDVEPIKVGLKVLTYPVGVQPVTISMVMRDHEDQRVSKWFESQIKKMVNADGTVNLPDKYKIEIKRFSIISTGNGEVETDKWEVIPTQMGDVTESRDGEGLLEFPIVFIQFRS